MKEETMSKRLEILEGSLTKKKAALSGAFDAHFADVKSANGQPLNDKRNGHVILNRWKKQSDGIRSKLAGVELTERAIEREEGKILQSASAMAGMPQPIVNLVEVGTLIQWRKHPTTFFVDGVDKARIQYKGGRLVHRYASAIKDKGQWAIFRDVVNGLNHALKQSA
jgi:hypothetical protein